MHVSSRVLLGIGLLILSLWGYVAVAYYYHWYARQAEQLQVVFCDVGQGDAALIILGSWQMLIDTGKDGQVLSCLDSKMPILDSQIEVLVLTHPDNDHMGAVNAVINEYNVGEILMTPYERKTADFMALYKLLLESKCAKSGRIWLKKCQLGKVRFPSVHEGWKVGQTLRIEVINPDLNLVTPIQKRQIAVPVTETTLQDVLIPADESGIDANDLSIVLFVQYKQHTFLFTGDIGYKTEQSLLEHGLLNDTTVLKVAHHGSKSSTSDEFLDAVRPEIALISAGKNNSYGHPAPETITRLRSRSIRVLETFQFGTLAAVTDGATLRFFSKHGEVRKEVEKHEK